jgi:signal transduction histidine kinase
MRDLGDRLHEDHAEESEKTAPVLSWVTDPSLGIVEIAPELAELAGAGPEPLIGQSLTRLFKLAENEDGEMPLVQAVAARKPFDAQPAELRLGDGTRLLLSGKPMRDEDGVFTGYMGRAEELVESEAEDAEGDEDASLSSLIEDLSGRIGAALKEPLDLIIANADSIRSQTDGPLRNGYANYASDIAEAGRHLVGLVNDLIEVQTIEKTDFQPVIEDIDLADVARRAAGLLAVRAAESGVRLDRPAEDEVIPARGDFRRALQVLVNLIGNGIRYSPPEGMIWIRAEQEGGNAAVIVADQGHGIAPEDQERIFEKFERLDPTEAGGSGLGLYISRTLARAMGGDILVDSALGQGARFIFTLPAS